MAIQFLRRLTGCWLGHHERIRELRNGQWFFVCLRCGHAQLMNPRDTDQPKAIGSFNAAKADYAKRQARRHEQQRVKIAAKRSVPSFPPDLRSTHKAADVRTFPKKAAR